MATNEEFLAKVPLFSRVGRRSLTSFAEACIRSKLSAGEILFREGDPGGSLYVIVSGRLRIERLTATGELFVIGMRGAGECVGDMSLIDGEPRSATVVAATNCRLLAMRRADFERLIQDEPSAGLAIMQTMSRRIREADDRTVDFRSKEVWQRLLEHLWSEADEVGVVRTGSQSALAETLGCTREAVNRAFGRLIREGKVARIDSRAVRLL